MESPTKAPCFDPVIFATIVTPVAAWALGSRDDDEKTVAAANMASTANIKANTRPTALGATLRVMISFPPRVNCPPPGSANYAADG
ncbi:MAG: hypothetical protein NVS9B1_24670 [Candidatus Dormibacteraceae bacterium]